MKQKLKLLSQQKRINLPSDKILLKVKLVLLNTSEHVTLAEEFTGVGGQQSSRSHMGSQNAKDKNLN